MGKLVLYSTNVFVKYYIQRRWRNNVHYVWCSEEFDSSKARSYSPSGQVPPTSNPVDIYRNLKRAIETGDTHNAKIVEQRNTLLQLAIDWENKGEISSADSADISYLVKHHSDFSIWRPLIYVIPLTSSVESRKFRVPLANCAGLGPEYIIKDLKDFEFDLIEV